MKQSKKKRRKRSRVDDTVRVQNTNDYEKRHGLTRRKAIVDAKIQALDEENIENERHSDFLRHDELVAKSGKLGKDITRLSDIRGIEKGRPQSVGHGLKRIKTVRSLAFSEDTMDHFWPGTRVTYADWRSTREDIIEYWMMKYTLGALTRVASKQHIKTGMMSKKEIADAIFKLMSTLLYDAENPGWEARMDREIAAELESRKLTLKN